MRLDLRGRDLNPRPLGYEHSRETCSCVDVPTTVGPVLGWRGKLVMPLPTCNCPTFRWDRFGTGRCPHGTRRVIAACPLPPECPSNSDGVHFGPSTSPDFSSRGFESESTKSR